MTEIVRRDFVTGAALGALVFTVAGAQVLLTARQARAQGVPFRVLEPAEVQTLEAVGETLASGRGRRASPISSTSSSRCRPRMRC